MAPCQISSIFGTFIMAGGLGLLALGLITVVEIVLTKGGERMELQSAN